MDKLDAAMDELKKAMDVEGLTPRQQLAIFDQVANLITLTHSLAWSQARDSVSEFITANWPKR